VTVLRTKSLLVHHLVHFQCIQHWVQQRALHAGLFGGLLPTATRRESLVRFSCVVLLKSRGLRCMDWVIH